MNEQTSSSAPSRAEAAPAVIRGSAAIPSLRYTDAHRMIDWLCRALGFTRKAVYDGPDNTVATPSCCLARPA